MPNENWQTILLIEAFMSRHYTNNMIGISWMVIWCYTTGTQVPVLTHLWTNRVAGHVQNDDKGLSTTFICITFKLHCSVLRSITLKCNSKVTQMKVVGSRLPWFWACLATILVQGCVCRGSCVRILFFLICMKSMKSPLCLMDSNFLSLQAKISFI